MLKVKDIFDGIESKIINYLNQSRSQSMGPIFIVAAPRTGSTLLYELFISQFKSAYFSNLTNLYFPSRPILGAYLQHLLRMSHYNVRGSVYGKIPGLSSPSEGSRVISNWYGGGHPSQVVSSEIIESKRDHFISTISAMQALFGRPIIVKNAWNCFRIDSLQRLLPNARFVWLRRDIYFAAISDLNARYVTKGSPKAWNSATPADYHKLQSSPYWEQVVENQYSYNIAIDESLSELPSEQTYMLWYEDLVTEPGNVLRNVTARFNLDHHRRKNQSQQIKVPLPAIDQKLLSEQDKSLVSAYIESNINRFGPHRYAMEKNAVYR